MNKSWKVSYGLWLCLVGGVLASGVLAGCGSGGASGALPVSGKVTKGGQPVAGAAVTFQPTASDGKAASGTTDDTGTYKLTTLVNGDGALPGSYKVTITKFPADAAPTTPEAGKEAKAADVDAVYKAMQAQGKYGPGSQDANSAATKNELNDKYSKAESSGLTAEVKSGSTNFDFQVD
jgi:hypothetical protein